jgi:hypothetical protein
MSKQKSFYQFEKDTGFWGVPNFSQDYVSDLNIEPVHISNNKYGFRDSDEYNDKLRNNIVIIGGSHSWGAGIANEQRYSDILAGRLRRQVINMAQCSLGIDQICIAILKKTQQFNPKIIVIEQYPWSVLRICNNNVNGYIKPYFSLDSNDNLELSKVPFFAKYKAIRQAIGQYRSYKKQLSEYQSGIDLSIYDPMLDPIFLSWKSAHYSYMYKLLEKIIIVIKDYCQSNNIKLLFALGTLDQQFKDGGEKKSLLIDYDYPRDKLQTILNRLNIDYIDTKDVMLSSHTQEDPVIFYDGHINAKGHRIFADLVEGFLKEKKWV